ncbi:MAG TPA: efflux RND transporter periplasmic adaptor subunit [Candidatus Thiothrix moscowensis]|uniref:efflux RND transporter periplasmic adaptor subunit n=1 Tax=unclassified Thiothrix TaxID=2636184 RepID=UPI0025FFB480|nr:MULTISPECIES: efflux RND transporter periplasmic adaptor subunit [unclassified Thiothrix]HRJ52496.1 efflux RND transporter periplasmic adaptor subunit [Candidatus Thiothrix moscowensis]HRJ93318.1 efflux RND transporter periplasmic adaptor subunit [Candidatus Thiothrix moscowensis]
MKNTLSLATLMLALSLATIVSLPLSHAEDKPADVPPTKAALAVTVASPQTQDWNSTITASGALTAWQEAIIASEISGLKITDVLVDVGTEVKKGQELAKLSQASVKADVAQAQARLDEARANATRARSLKTSGALPAQQIDQYLTGEAVAQAALEAQQIRLAQTRILAPDDGVIAARTATLGAVVQTGTELFRMVRQNKLEWRAEIAGRDASRIQPGQQAHLTLPGGESVSGEVRMVSPTLDPNTRNAIVYISLPSDSPAKAGMFAEGAILTGSAKAMTLPQSAVILRDGNYYVFEIGTENKVAQRQVKVGRTAQGQTEITDGVDASARVVVTGGGFLNDGDTVEITPLPNPPPQGVREQDAPSAPTSSLPSPPAGEGSGMGGNSGDKS